MQPDKVSKSEDCLTLNVLAPPLPRPGPLPVMVWIYGGAFGARAKRRLYPADALARQGVIVVSMNYRMGRLGFFCAFRRLAAEAPDDVCAATMVTWNQRAALRRWVSERNIAAFWRRSACRDSFSERSAGAGSVCWCI